MSSHPQMWNPLHILAMSACLMPAPASSELLQHTPPVLCELLERIGPGDRLPVMVSGVYYSGNEHSVLYDPRTPLCALDVQPVTWVGFQDGVPLPEGFAKLVEEQARVFVVLKGVLFGPGFVEEDDRAISPIFSYAARTAFDRYGHLGAFRTQLFGAEVVDFHPVRPEDEHQFFINRPELSAAPVVISADAPTYPPLPRQGGVQGPVAVRVVVKEGQVMEAVRLAGDRMLADAAIDAVRSWVFQPDFSGELVSRFEYVLELRETGADQNLEVEMDFPYRVRVTAPARGW